MSIKNDRLGYRKDWQNCENNIPLVLESPNSQKILQKEKINGICINYNFMCCC